ncbi:phospholipase [Kordiimonas sediminis]|uniref:Phospholipase D n=1 Tax=Kordiimonas sediminis TaxID=1735581 RepID=A0A919AM79_9PROT|nr:phospholipase [Kordiimonas sediminis]
MFGLIFYFLFGISRIRRRARRSREQRGMTVREETGDPFGEEGSVDKSLPFRWQVHDQLASRVSGMPITKDNALEPLISGRDAYDAMIDAIDQAHSTIMLTSYIFQADQAGRRFIAALLRAKERGVKIRVLVDAIGNLYGLKPVTPLLRRKGIKVATFNPARLSWRLAFFNLRTHRKILITDGITGFTGGMNIRKHHLGHTDKDGNHVPKVRDIHFKLTGPIVRQMVACFTDDWFYSTSEELDPATWMPQVPKPVAEGVEARTLPDGPDDPFEVTAMVIESALASAYESAKIVTPYFIPSESLIAALKQAALRGVKVDIVTPKVSNLPFFSLVSLAGMRQLIDSDCNIYLSPEPFDHAKLMVVDKSWVLFGSSNWDARSLRLNFEFNVECYGGVFAETMDNIAAARIQESTKLDLKSLKKRPGWKRMLGRVLWLASPYL